VLSSLFLNDGKQFLLQKHPGGGNMITFLTALLLICLIIVIYLISKALNIYPKSFKFNIGLFKLEIENEERHTPIRKKK
jgi:hypothetical protein